MDNATAQTLAGLTVENERLRQENAELRRICFPGETLPPAWKLTPQEATVFLQLLKREKATREGIAVALYGTLGRDDYPKVIQVFVCRVRKKLARYGIEIKTIWGDGYFLPVESRERAHALIAAFKGETPS